MFIVSVAKRQLDEWKQASAFDLARCDAFGQLNAPLTHFRSKADCWSVTDASTHRNEQPRGEIREHSCNDKLAE